LAAATANLRSGRPECAPAGKRQRQRSISWARAHQGGPKRGAGTPKVARSSYAESSQTEGSATARARAPPPPERNGADFAAPQAAAHSGRSREHRSSLRSRSRPRPELRPRSAATPARSRQLRSPPNYSRLCPLPRPPRPPPWAASSAPSAAPAARERLRVTRSMTHL